MNIRFSEKPSEWLKTLAALCLMPILVASLAWRRLWLSDRGLVMVLLLALGSFACGYFHHPFARSAYRLARRFGAGVGAVAGAILLSMVYLLFVLPFGVALRLAGRNLLGLRPGPSEPSTWREVRPQTPLDRMF